ncbi:MAG TPA: ISL3 family transposase [Terrimicrobiaceae bacterium]|nr:ISL3 family transposase [Terrimicrobiaceae bacterium]
MLVKTILNRIEKHAAFVYQEVRFRGGQTIALEIEVRARRGARPNCSGCSRRGSVYDTLREREFQFVPLWGIPVFLLYAMRRVNCRWCGVLVESVPWAEGKRRTTISFEWFLAVWAKRLNWTEVSQIFGTSWETVFRAVERAVDWGRSHADYSGIEAIGIDEIQWRFGQTYLTLVYQIDVHVRRLIWVGEARTQATLNRFFDWLGADRIAELRFICSDMWKAYLNVIRKRAAHCLHVLDRFHIVAHLSKAIDKVRASEARDLRKRGRGELLKHSRWAILRRPENRTEKDHLKLVDIVRANLRTARSVLLREELYVLWTYHSRAWAGKFLDAWCRKVLRSRIEPLKTFARTLRNHRELILNWFHAKALSSGIVEGFNGKAKLTMKKAFGFRTHRAIEVALYHTLGDLPLPDSIHRFC